MDEQEGKGMGKRGSGPWVEKYRPRTVARVSQQRQVTSALLGAVRAGSLPHLLFHGPPGSGKTTTALALARDIYGKHMASRVLELNASDERAIDTVRTQIKDFARSAVVAADLCSSPDGHLLPPFKLIVLDEADSMTAGAQAALRRIIEAHTLTTRFCLICNYVSRIAVPLACVGFPCTLRGLAAPLAETLPHLHCTFTALLFAPSLHFSLHLVCTLPALSLHLRTLELPFFLSDCTYPPRARVHAGHAVPSFGFCR